jgi:protein-disulfide isomerase
MAPKARDFPPSRPSGRRLSLAVAAAALCALSLSACGRDNDEVFGERVRAFLIAHPEVLKEAQEAYYAKLDAEKVARAKPVIEKHAREIFADPRDPFVGPANAKVTVVQFFDYRCPHCKAEAAPGVLALIKRHPDVKFVFKEFPIFGGPSQAASRTALSVWRSDPKDYLPVYANMMADEDLDESVNDPAGAKKMQASVDKIVQAAGLDPNKITTFGASDAISAQLADTQRLAAELGVDGTPGFVVGDTLITGADMDKVEQLIEKGEKKG